VSTERDAHDHEHAHAHPGTGEHVHDHEHDHPKPVSSAAAEDRWIEISHLHYTYPDGFEALRGIDLTVARGEKVALVGPNGAGKSTLMLHLNGINRPRHGSVAVGGLTVDGTNARRIRAEVGLVFQDPDDQLFSPTVFDDVAFGPLHMGVAEDEIHRRVEQALEAVGMSGSERRLPSHLSIGQRKRVALATVLSMDPSVLVFDEPSAGLDPRGRRQLIELLRGLSQTLLVATHDMRLVAEVLPRTVVMDGGLIVAEGATDAILADATLLERHGLEAP
jgi:cobalt/nickel transport system ATP-binding protein